jgi:uncharacterized membrane protein
MTETLKSPGGGKTNALLRVVNLCLVLALALASVIFFLVVPTKDRTSVAWIDLAAALFLIFLNMITFQWIVFKASRKAETIAAVSVQGGIVWMYDLAAAAAIVASFFARPENAFGVFLSIHLVLAFLVLFGIAATLVLDRYVATIDGKERRGGASISELRSMTERIAATFAHLPAEFDAAKRSFLASKDDIRYFAPNPSDNAIRLEGEIRTILSDLEAKIAVSPADAAAVNALAVSLAEKVTLRKPMRQ